MFIPNVICISLHYLVSFSIVSINIIYFICSWTTFFCTFAVYYILCSAVIFLAITYSFVYAFFPRLCLLVHSTMHLFIYIKLPTTTRYIFTFYIIYIYFDIVFCSCQVNFSPGILFFFHITLSQFHYTIFSLSILSLKVLHDPSSLKRSPTRLD